MTTAAAIADAKLKKAKHRWIAIRYRRGRKPVSMATLRCAELNRLFSHRYGHVLPDDDAGRDDARIMAHHLAMISGDQQARVKSRLVVWAPWMSTEEVSRLVEAVLAKPIRWRADTLGKRLNLTEADRSRLGITTIGAADMTKEEREAAREARMRQAKREQRRKQGAKPRAEYEAAALGHGRPWEAEGKSRRTWYRQQKSKRENLFIKVNEDDS